MNTYERLEDEACKDGIDVVPYHFKSKRIKGLYSDNVIGINKNIKTEKEKACVLAEELGHYHTSSGNIIDLSDVRNQKQELRARSWAYDKQIGLIGIINAYKHGCQNLYEMAEYLGVTEEFLKKALQRYRNRYGECTQIDQYVIFFEPHLAVIETKD